MNKKTLKHVAQFTRGVHQVLPKSNPQYGGYWHDEHEPATIGYPDNGIDSIAGVEMVIHQARNVGKSIPMNRIVKLGIVGFKLNFEEPVETDRFCKKATIPRGISRNHPYGNPTVKSLGHRVSGGMIIRPLVREFFEEWIRRVHS